LLPVKIGKSSPEFWAKSTIPGGYRSSFAANQRARLSGRNTFDRLATARVLHEFGRETPSVFGEETLARQNRIIAPLNRLDFDNLRLVQWQ
jgi:hypothetical protein